MVRSCYESERAWLGSSLDHKAYIVTDPRKVAAGDLSRFDGAENTKIPMN